MPGQPPVRPFHRRDLSLPSSGLSRTDAAPSSLWAGFIIQMEHYNGLNSDAALIAACSKAGLVPIYLEHLKKEKKKSNPNMFMSSGCVFRTQTFWLWRGDSYNIYRGTADIKATLCTYKLVKVGPLLNKFCIIRYPLSKKKKKPYPLLSIHTITCVIESS